MVSIDFAELVRLVIMGNKCEKLEYEGVTHKSDLLHTLVELKISNK